MSILIEFETEDGDTIGFKIEDLISLEYKKEDKQYIVKTKNGSREFETVSKSTFLYLMDKWYQYLANNNKRKPLWSKDK